MNSTQLRMLYYMPVIGAIILISSMFVKDEKSEKILSKIGIAILLISVLIATINMIESNIKYKMNQTERVK